MKASEMTNDELATELENGALNFDPCEDDEDIGTHEILTEAAARLRKQYKSCKECEAKCDPQFCDYLAASCRERENARRRLKVAEDALKMCKNAMCNYCRSTPEAKGLPCLNGCETLAIAKNALATIREKGGAK